MRNTALTIILTLFTMLLSFGQTVTTTRTGGYFYSKCTDGFETQPRAVFRLASNDGENYVIQNRGVECVVKSPDHTITSSGFENVSVQAKQIDTTFYTTQTNKIFDKITNARYFSVVYRPDSTKRHINVLSIVAKDSLPKPLDCQECGTKPIKIHFKAKQINGNIFDAMEISHEYIVKDSVIETPIDSFEIKVNSFVFVPSTKRLRYFTNKPSIMWFAVSNDSINFPNLEYHSENPSDTTEGWAHGKNYDYLDSTKVWYIKTVFYDKEKPTEFVNAFYTLE